MFAGLTGGTTMTEPKLEVPAELRALAEKTIEQAEQAFALLFDAARRSAAANATTTAELTRQVLAFSEESLRLGFAHARKVASTESLQEIANAQSDLVKRQIAGAEHHIRELARTSGSDDET
jgi:hypothetical protein